VYYYYTAITVDVFFSDELPTNNYKLKKPKKIKPIKFVDTLSICGIIFYVSILICVKFLTDWIYCLKN
jgi:hypothetical protein